MYVCSILLLMLPLPTMQATQLEAPRYADSRTASDTATPPSITITKLDVTNTRLELSYEVRNTSGHEVWICDDIGFDRPYDCEICLSEDHQVVTLRKRLDVPSDMVWFERPRAKYVRLRAGEKRRESLSVNVPLDGVYVLEHARSGQTARGLFYVSGLAIEVGYYDGNLPEMIINMIGEAEKALENNPGTVPPILATFGDVLSFNYSRERLRNREGEIVIPYTYQQLKGEKVLRTTIDGLRIPCERRQRPGPHSPPDLKTCTKLDIRFIPSAIEYLFPFAIEQSLLSPKENQYLRSDHSFFVQDENALRAFAREIVRGRPFGGVAPESKIAHFDCYHDNGSLTSFDMYENGVLETKEKQPWGYLPSSVRVAALVPEIQKLEYRVQCAVNLRDLYYRLRVYNLIVAKREKNSSLKGVVAYPTATCWFDSITTSVPIPASLMRTFWVPELRKAHVCPSVGKGKSTYGMNPDCRPNSPPDTVLLFETNAGWNQHGGPELFTFDNHDPKGGCVLLNDGTVKFIRTEEELKQLRWK
jgi:hypothetical protein